MSTKQKTKKVKAVQQKRKLFRANEPVLSVFMWGVNHSITGLSHVIEPIMLLPEHFKAFSKVKVDNHLFNKENMPSHFKVKEYCPLVFRNIRERFNINDDDFMNSLTKSQPVDQYETSGKSGARFLLSSDSHYVIKTITSEEVEEMHRMLKEYHQHIVERHANTLLPHYLALYRVTVNDQETYMIVMRNVFSPLRKIHTKYDIKGSTVDRCASEKERGKELPTLKDMDFISDEVKIAVGLEQKEKFIEVLQADVEWLTKLNLMDYSLLIGIHDVERAHMEAEEEAARQEENGQDSSDDAELSSSPAPAAGHSPPQESLLTTSQLATPLNAFDPELERFAFRSNNPEKLDIYYMALIDILTHYGVKKRTANAAKQVKHGTGAEISTVKPEQYAKRFIEFVTKYID